MEIFEILENAPRNEVIGDNLVRAYSKINSPLYKKIICTVSGGYDSDVVIDICQQCDKDKKIEYVFFDTGIEYKATKEHIKYLEKKYGIKINKKRPKKPIPTACKEFGVPFLSKKYRSMSDDYRDMVSSGRTNRSRIYTRNTQNARQP